MESTPTYLTQEELDFLREVAQNEGEFIKLNSDQIGEWIRIGRNDYSEPNLIRIKYLDMAKELESKNYVERERGVRYRITRRGLGMIGM